MTSCYTNRHTIGNGPYKNDEKVKYSKAKDIYLFWGLAQIGQAAPRIPSSGNYMVRSRFSFGDMLISDFTLGIVGTRSVKIFIKPEDQIKK
jgi:hypothetical protein